MTEEFNVVRYTTKTPIHVIQGPLIAKGGEGIVYRATFGGEPMLLKQMMAPAELPLVNQIEREMLVQTSLNSCSNASYFSCFRGFIGPQSFYNKFRIGDYKTYAYIGMAPTIYLLYELIDGSDLYDIIRANGLTNPQKLSILEQLLTALQILHTAGIAHRDLKPENLMLTSNGQLKIIDFGHACKGSGSCSYDRPVGSMLYAAPETIGADRFGNTEKAPLAANPFPADIFSIGLILFELVIGLYFAKVVDPGIHYQEDARNTLSTINLHQKNETPRRLFEQQGMGAYYDLFLRMIRQDPGARPTAREALEELNRIKAAPVAKEAHAAPVLLPELPGGFRRLRPSKTRITRRTCKNRRRTRIRSRRS